MGRTGLNHNEEEGHLELILDDCMHVAWNWDAVVKTEVTPRPCNLPDRVDNWVSYSVVQHMVRAAYHAGVEKGGKKLAEIKHILEK